MGWLSFLGLEQFFSAENVVVLLRSGVTLLLGLFIARFAARAAAKLVSKRASDQQTLLAKRLCFYTVASLAIVSALGQLGINLGVLLGAAGVLTVAIGFASQTSASNLVSGLFLMAERPFVVGDWIKVDDVFGIVVAIDLLAVRIRLFDNALVRIPNETLIKNRLTNLTHFPIRRIDIEVGVAYKEDAARVRGLLFEIADHNPLVLENPKPQFFFDGFGDSSLNLRFCVWTAKENVIEVRNEIQLRIKEVFDREGVEIPFPHRSLYSGSMTGPFPVRLVGPDGSGVTRRPE